MKRTPMKRSTALRQVSAKRRAFRSSKEGQDGLEHMRRVKMLPCVICKRPGPSDAHHIICDRYGSAKASDFETIPLCKSCHQDGPEAIHNGKASWVKRHGPDHSYLPLVDQWLRAMK